MKLQNSLPHMRNSNVMVNGETYKINEGIIDIEDEIGISYLLQNSAWSRVNVVNRSPLRTPIQTTTVDYSKMKKEEIVALLKYKNVQFDETSKKAELVEIAQQLNLGA